MRSAAAALTLFSGTLQAHSGHGAAQGHFHAFGIEHAVLLAAILAFLAFAAKK
jgi:hypothetical protein